MAAAFHQVGFNCVDVHMQDLISKLLIYLVLMDYLSVEAFHALRRCAWGQGKRMGSGRL